MKQPYVMKLSVQKAIKKFDRKGGYVNCKKSGRLMEKTALDSNTIKRIVVESYLEFLREIRVIRLR